MPCSKTFAWKWAMPARISAIAEFVARTPMVAAPSASVPKRTWREAWMARWRACSSSPACLRRAASSCRPFNDSRSARPSRSASAPGATSAASATAAAWGRDSRPSRSASVVAGSSFARAAVCSVDTASATEVPDSDASQWAADRWPWRCQIGVSATRAGQPHLRPDQLPLGLRHAASPTTGHARRAPRRARALGPGRRSPAPPLRLPPPDRT